jgi:CubicO group peptidase (beta-lactamase class C family)
MKILSKPEDFGFSTNRLERLRSWATSYIDSARLPCSIIAIMRHGKLVFVDIQGFSDVENQTPVHDNTLFRIYSMTKPITSVAAMMLYEEGRFQLDDPVWKYIPAFKNMTVCLDPNARHLETEPAASPITIRQLLTHTAGFIYSFKAPSSALGKLYSENDLDLNPQGSPLAQWVETLARVPLASHPGSRWEYGVSTDVLGHLIEIISGQPLDVFFRQRILEPLEMGDTGFEVDDQDIDRLANLYKYKVGDRMALSETAGKSRFRAPVSRFQGGGGLISTLSDYLRFQQMLLNKGCLGDVRILGRKTVEYMTANHLPGDLASMGQPRFGETVFEGVGFGLGFAVMLDPAKAQLLASVGEYNWGGSASTAFYNDPLEDMSVIFLTQLSPSEIYPLRRELRILVNQALVD